MYFNCTSLGKYFTKHLSTVIVIEVRFHGRGGQGVVLASEILASAAFLDGKDVQSFPFFGVERRGAPLMAFTRISDQPIRIRSEVKTPHYVLVLDPSLVRAVDVSSGIRSDGLLLTNGPPEMHLNASSRFKTLVFDATSVSLEHGLGSRTAPIVNTAMLGAFAAATDLIRIESLEESILELVPRKAEANVAACRTAYVAVAKEVEIPES